MLISSVVNHADHLVKMTVFQGHHAVLSSQIFKDSFNLFLPEPKTLLLKAQGVPLRYNKMQSAPAFTQY